ncbi:centlein [Gadus morhua]|uniref:centlein n=1 Tax=Gadus morhua TaxID=8049 RepID=UPI0011B6DA82|nr:centlein [Gadus morhua]
MDPNSIELLEAQVKTLSDELMQCQADKEFVWSLWKRLQVANPDLTQAVSLVVEREKQKGEMKDRKVLEILQTKDYKIQELEQRVTVQQQEVNLVQQRKMLMDEERAGLNKEISSLQERLASNSQDIKEMRAQHASSEEEARGAMRALEEQKEEWASRCAGLHADLEEERRRASHCDDQREATRARIKELEAELPQFSSLQSENSSLAALLSAKDKEMEAQEGHLSQLRGELVEVQALYRQSMEHGSEQGHLIKQLEALNLDSQRVLRNQEEAHSVDATSYQRLYTELSQSYQALVAGEAQLRQNHLELSGLLAQRDQQILELQSQLQQQDLLAHRDQQILELQSQLQQQQQQEKRLLQTQQQQQAHQTTTTTTTTTGQQPNKQTNVKELCQPSADTPVSSGFNQASNFSSPGLGTSTPLDGGAWTERTWKASSSRGRSTSIRQQDAPVQRSRSLSPASCVEAGGGGGGGGREGGGAEQRMQDLEELLQLKTKEMEVLRSAHQNRLERLHLIQANYRTIRDQLRDAEEADGLPKPKGPSRRAEPWQLRQEDSDGVWNELAYFKRLARKLDVEKRSSRLCFSARGPRSFSTLKLFLGFLPRVCPAQKLTCDLAGVELQKKVLEMELEQWRKMQLPPPPPPPAPPAAATGAAESCSCQGRGLTAPNNLGLQALEAEVKQLQGKLKSGSAEASRQASAIKTLRAQVQDKEDKLRMLQDKLSHSERDLVMKRQLVEDLRTRLKVLQDGEGSHRGQVEDLERKVKSQSEEANNRKTFIESLKRRLSVATSEKSQHETSCTKLREELERKERLLETLQAQVGADQRSLAQLEQTATRQMEGLTQQSSQALDVLQRRLGLASSQKEQLHAFVKALAGEMLRDVQEVKQQLTETRSRRKRSRRRHEEANAAKGAPTAKSMIRAKSIAASILNMSERDLADMLDGDQDETEPCVEIPDEDWLQHLHHILQQKIPSAGQLMEAVRVKMKERKVLTEELAALATPVSENA